MKDFINDINFEIQALQKLLEDIQTIKAVSFEIDTRPIGQQRHRTTYLGHNYTPKKTKEFQSLIKWLYRASSRHIFTGPVALMMKFCFAVPVSTTKTETKRIVNKVYVPYPKKPDTDNVEKAILDALNKVAWNDDRQVTNVSKRKCYDKTNRIIIHIYEDKEI